MPGDGTTFGLPLICNLTRFVNDTLDISFHLTNADGTDASIVGWTAVLSVGSDKDNLITGSQATYPGTGLAAGVLPIDFNLFDIPAGSYKYDLRITDTVSPDTPSWVIAEGSFKVTVRID